MARSTRGAPKAPPPAVTVRAIEKKRWPSGSSSHWVTIWRGVRKTLMHRPQRAAAAVPRERKAGAVQPLGDVAGRIDADQEERHPLLPRPLQRREPVRGLLEAGAELARQRLEIVAARLDGPGEGGVGHDERRRRVAGQRPARQPLAALGGEVAVVERGADLVFHLQVGELQRQLEVQAGGVERVVEQQLAAVPVEPPHRADHARPAAGSGRRGCGGPSDAR